MTFDRVGAAVFRHFWAGVSRTSAPPFAGTSSISELRNANKGIETRRSEFAGSARKPLLPERHPSTGGLGLGMLEPFTRLGASSKLKLNSIGEGAV